jgi:hypothetical protein
VDLIWDNFKPKVIHEVTWATTHARITGLDRRPDMSLVTGYFDALKKSFEELKSKYSNIDSEGQSLKKEVKDLRGMVETLTTTVDNLVSKCSVLEEKAVSPNESALSSGEIPTIDHYNNSQSNFNDRFAKVEYQMTLIESRLGQSVLDFGSILLQSYQDTCLFTNDHIKSNSFGCFFDLMALLNSPRDTNTDEKSFLESLYNAQKTKFISISEVSTSTSFLHVTPLCFCKASQ